MDQPLIARRGMPVTAIAPELARPDLYPASPAAVWRSAALVTLCLLVAAFAFQSARALWEPDEGRYTAVALQMLDSGDWLVPRLNDHREHLTKPPLTYWALATSFAVSGRSELAARLPNALAFALTGLLVWLFARELRLHRPWLAPYAWGSALLPLLAANVVTTDTLLACWQTAAMYAWWRMQDAPRRRQRFWRLAMWATFGLGFLTKGPPALLPLLPILAVARWSARKATTPTLIDAPSALAFFVLGPAWFIWLVSQRPELLGYFLGHEFIDRIFSDVHGRNAQWYGAITVYLPALLLAAFPWGLYTALQWLRRDRTAGRATGEPVFRAAWQRRLLWAWLLIPLTVFVIAQSRLVLYVVPLAVPLALLIARALDTHWRTPLPRGVVVALCVWAGAALAVKGATTSLESTKDARALAAQLAQLAPDARRLVFVDAKARHGLRFYLDLPVEQVGSTVANVPVAHGQRGHLLCDELELSPGLVAIGHGTLLGDGARRAARPTCPGWVFATPRMGSGVWIPRAATPGPSPAS